MLNGLPRSPSPSCFLLLMGWMIAMACCENRGDSAEFSREHFFTHALPRNEAQWQAVAKSDPPPQCGIRWIYDYALLLAESGQNLSRIDRLLQIGEGMQDRDSASPTFGNFRWYWRTPTVTDDNAVEFVAHHMIPLWIRHRRKLTPPARQALERTLRRAVDGCLNHGVRPTYTNIAISNAVNLVLLGEQCDRDDALAEGLRRLDAVCTTTWQHGICEYDSPTYYGVILDMLVLLDRHVESPKARKAGQALLELFWIDIAVNWFAPGAHLAGTHSRSYNYPCGASDFLARHLARAGWAPGRYRDWAQQRHLDSPEKRFLDGVAWLDAEPSDWRPPQKLREMMEQYPRDVHQRFGPLGAQWRRHLVYPNITLGCSGKGYGVMDLPLTISLPGERTASRCYFIADGREDPYGKRKLSLGSAGHTKAVHLRPLWAAASGGDEAMAVALYPDDVVGGRDVVNLQSHFVLRRPDETAIDGKPCSVEREKPVRLATGAVLILRYGAAAVAVCVPWATDRDGAEAPIHLVDDGSPRGVWRLTVDHWGAGKAGAKEGHPLPGAAIWVRIASQLGEERFAKWPGKTGRLDFAIDARAMRFSSVAGDDAVRLTIDTPWSDERKVHVEPAPPEGILSLNGRELGHPIIEHWGRAPTPAPR